jgi:hypothetical protein
MKYEVFWKNTKPCDERGFGVQLLKFLLLCVLCVSVAEKSISHVLHRTNWLVL